jgi:acetyl-CoA carboxylase carboxyl transferase subunit alpha
LGLSVTDRVFILENSWYSVIAPESASSILYRDNAQKERAAEELRMSATTV